MRKKTLTDRSIAALKPRPRRYAVPDPGQPNHYVRVMPGGAKSYVVVAPDPHARRQVWATIGGTDHLSLAEARARARTAIQRIRDGLPPFEAPKPRAATFEDVAEQWLKRHVRAKGLRSESEIVRLLAAHVYPAWKGRPFEAIRRSDVTTLLDEVEDGHSAKQADYVLSVVPIPLNRQAARTDNYLPVIVRGMKRYDSKASARSRILDDDELRQVWQLAESAGTLGAFVRVALLTGQRREKLLTMRWTDIDVSGTWTIATAPREKGNPGELLLPVAAMEIINALPRFPTNPFVFAGWGNGHFRAPDNFQVRFVAKLGLPRFTVHDLRRTARSLMARAGVPREHAERVMGHAVGGIEGIYDRHAYADEKAAALARLATLIDRIVDPTESNVGPMVKQGGHSPPR
jgi:integrase